MDTRGVFAEQPEMQVAMPGKTVCFVAGQDEATGRDYVAYGKGPFNWSGYRSFVAAVDPTRIVSQSNTTPNIAAVLRSGIGVGLLPCFIGNDEPMLMRCFDAPRKLTAESWLLTSPEALSSPQLRAFVDFLVPRLLAQRNLLTGGGQGPNTRQISSLAKYPRRRHPP